VIAVRDVGSVIQNWRFSGFCRRYYTTLRATTVCRLCWLGVQYSCLWTSRGEFL